MPAANLSPSRRMDFFVGNAFFRGSHDETGQDDFQQFVVHDGSLSPKESGPSVGRAAVDRLPRNVDGTTAIQALPMLGVASCVPSCNISSRVTASADSTGAEQWFRADCGSLSHHSVAVSPLPRTHAATTTLVVQYPDGRHKAGRHRQSTRSCQ